MAQLSAHETCVLYLALKNHFTTKSYDFIKYNGKVNISKDTFSKRRDYYSFQKLSRLYGDKELKDFLIANFVYRPDETKWVGSLFEAEANSAWNRFQKEYHSLTYTFKEDISKINLEEDFKGTDPEILNLFYGNHISIFTMIILDDILHFSDAYNARLKDNFLWKEIEFKLRKFRPFFQYQRKKYVEILKNEL